MTYGVEDWTQKAVNMAEILREPKEKVANMADMVYPVINENSQDLARKVNIRLRIDI